jgi:hypothetical protein
MRTLSSRWLAIVGMLALGGCGETVSVGNDNPTGTVSGLLLTAGTEAPLSGAAVKILAGGEELTATSDTNGVFKVERVPAGTFVISISATGYATVTLNDTLGGAVGNFPVRNPTKTIGPLGLIPNDGTFTVRVVNDAGAPASMIPASAHVNVRYVNYASGYGSPVGDYVVTATSDGNGNLVFNGIPNFQTLRAVFTNAFYTTITVEVSPTKVMGTGGEYYNFLGVRTDFDLGGLNTTVPTITLSGPATALNALEASVSYIVGPTNPPVPTTTPPAGPITVTFNQALDPNSVRVFLTNEDGLRAGVPDLNATVNLNVLSLTPAMGLTPGARYNLHLRVVAAGAPELNQLKEFTRVVPLFTTPTTPVSIVSMRLTDLSAGIGIIQFSEPVGPGIGYAPGTVFSCIAFWEMELGLGPEIYQGEWTSMVSQLRCPYQNPIMSPTPGPAADVTRIESMENTGQGTAATGFSTKWRFYGGSGCPVGSNSCPVPQSNTTTAHLVFSRLPQNLTFRRVTGQALQDNLTKTVQ